MAGLENLSERDKAVLRSIFDPTATIGDVVEEKDSFEEDIEPDTDAFKQSSSLCCEGVRLAEAGKLDEALQVLNRGVETAPNRPSAYNDRAQLLRMMQKDDEAMSDLDRVLELTAGNRTRSRAQALCQRGLLFRKRGKQDEARKAFAEAAQLGSSFAKQQMVELNPYAALCNQMLSQVLRGEEITL